MTALDALVSTFTLALPAVFFIVDPIGVVPVFVAMTGRDTPEKCRAMARRACLTAAGVLVFFALGGGLIFRVFGVTLPAFRVAGGLLLLLTALDMLRAQHPTTKTTEAETQAGSESEDIAVVPLALPLLAGPGAIATVMVLMAESGGGLEAGAAVVAAILLTLGATYAVLRSAHHVKRVLKTTGIAILERIFGLILAAIAVQFVFEGAKALWRA
jgi:multiple antibiotic resistance protein